MSGDGVVADESFDRYARLVCALLDVPVGLVSLVEPDRQVFPGAVGLAAPWSELRETPLSHSFCQHVVADDAALIVPDARLDPRVRDNLAIPDLGVVAYAGFPLHDSQGVAIGSLCAISGEPREWAPADLAMLEDLAHCCTTEITLRESRRELTASAKVATDVSQRARVWLALSEALAETVTTADIAAALQEVTSKQLGCLHAGIWLVTPRGDELSYVEHPSEPWPQAQSLAVLPISADNPLGATIVELRPLHYVDRAAQDEEWPAFRSERPRDGDGQARAILPLFSAGQPLGVLVLMWAEEREVDVEDRVTMAALASYTSQAVHRTQLLDERTDVAATLQAALLTELPEVDGIELVARYLTSATADQVGGDWYDAVVMPSGVVHLVIGDVAGHDVIAAARMGALRSMLRALAWAVDGAPSTTVSRLDRASHDLGPAALATLVLARIEPPTSGVEAGWRRLRWTNAGHVPPVLLHADGTCLVLQAPGQADCLLGVAPDRARHDHTASVAPGSTLLLFTDGLIETRTEDIDQGLARLTAALERHHALPTPDLLDALIGDLVDDARSDDVALLAVRFT